MNTKRRVGRPRLVPGPTTDVSLRLIDEELARLDRIAAAAGVSRGWMARQLVLQGLGCLPIPSEGQHR